MTKILPGRPPNNRPSFLDEYYANETAKVNGVLPLTLTVNDDIGSIGASATVCCNPTLAVVHGTSDLTAFDINPKGLREAQELYTTKMA